MSTIKLNTALLLPGAHILCAVSGGMDSVCLLSLLRERPDIRLSAAHYNHRLRGGESDDDEKFVRALCGEWGIPAYFGSGDVAAAARDEGLSLETAAREMRYAFLYATAERIGADFIATAHNADDNAETLLMRLARGTALRGLCGIPEKRGILIRPLLGVKRSEIETYLNEKALPHREDSSNAEDEAARNRIRHYALPALRSVNPAFEDAVGRCIGDLQQDEDCLERLAEQAYEELSDGEALSVSGLLALHPALQSRVLRIFAGGNLQQSHRNDILRLCEKEGNGKLNLPGMTLCKSYNRLLPVTEGENPAEDREILPGSCFSWGNYHVTVQLSPFEGEIQNSFTIFSFSRRKICGTLMLTCRREGDSILFDHREGKRKLRRLFIDAKIPSAERSGIPVLRDDEGVLAVYGFGRSRRAIPEKGEEALRVMIEKNSGGTE